MAEEKKAGRPKKEAPIVKDYLVSFEAVYGNSRHTYRTSVYFQRDLKLTAPQFVINLRASIKQYMQDNIAAKKEQIHSIVVLTMIELCLLFFIAVPAMSQSAPQSLQMYEDNDCNKYTVTLNGGALSIASWGSTPSLWCTIENPKRNGKFSYREGKNVIKYQLEGTRIKNLQVQSSCTTKKLYACF